MGVRNTVSVAVACGVVGIIGLLGSLLVPSLGRAVLLTRITRVLEDPGLLDELARQATLAVQPDDYRSI